MKAPLKEALAQHYGKMSLSDKQLATLESRMQQSPRNWPKTFKLLGGVAAALVLGMIAANFLWVRQNDSTGLATLTQEIAYHHNKHMEPEIKTSSMAELKRQLVKLDFSLIESAKLPKDQWELVGGRYCSLQGQLVAQIKMLSKSNNKEYTLYQLALPEDLQGLTEVYEDHYRGTRVKIWQERDLLLGIAGDE